MPRRSAGAFTLRSLLVTLPAWSCLSIAAVAADTGSEVARLVAEKKLRASITTYSTVLSPQVRKQVPEEEQAEPAIYFSLKLKNVSGADLPGWTMAAANAVTATLYRMEKGGEVKIGWSQWNLMGGVYEKSPPGVVVRDGPIARIPPGDSVQASAAIRLSEEPPPTSDELDGYGRMFFGQNGRYRVVFRLAANGADLASCQFSVDGEPGVKFVEIDLATDSPK